MPIYEYECSQCHHRFDRRQDFDAEPVDSCPLCLSKARRVIHSVAVIYKGSGFYTTDYARKDNNARAEEPVKPEKKEEKAASEPSSPKD